MKNKIKENRELAYSLLCLLSTYLIWWSSAYAVVPLYKLQPRICWGFILIVYLITLLLSIYAIYLSIGWGAKRPVALEGRKFLGFIPNTKMSVFSILFIAIGLIDIWIILSLFVEHSIR